MELTPQSRNFELIQDLMALHVTCKNEEVPIKSEGAKWSQHYTSVFTDAQGQLTPHSVVVAAEIRTHPSF